VWQEAHLAFLKSVKIYEEQVCSKHTKLGYFAEFEDCSGQLRLEPIVDGDDELEPPEFIAISRLKYDLFPGHQSLLLKAMEHLNLY